jgi:sulfite reductase (ferredoxin)
VLYVGGRVAGDRLNFEAKDLVPRGEIVKVLRPLLVRYREDRQAGEGFGDYCRRLGAEVVRAMLHR